LNSVREAAAAAAAAEASECSLICAQFSRFLFKSLETTYTQHRPRPPTRVAVALLKMDDAMSILKEEENTSRQLARRTTNV
jgi:hypothetical protein